MLRRFWQRRRQRPFTCTDVDANVERVRDGRLSARETAAFKAHVAECDACRQRLQTETTWLSTLQATPAPARLTPTERRAMQQALGRQMRRGIIMRNIRLSVQQVAVVGVLALVVGAMVWWQTAVTSENSPPSLSPEKTIITFADFAETAQQYDSLIAEFNQQHDDITIQFVPVASAAILQGDNAAHFDTLASQGDTFLFSVNHLDGNYGRFLDLTPLMNNDAAFVTNDFWPGTLSGCRASSTHQFGLPLNVGFSLIFYDNNAFVEAGLAPPQPDWTWDDFLATAELLTQKQNGETVRYGFVNTQNSGLFFYPLLANQAAGELENNTDLATVLNDYVNLHLIGAMPLPDGAKLPWEQQIEMEEIVLQGQAAMWTDAFSLHDGRQFSLGDAVDIQMVSFPRMGNVENTTPASTLLCGAISAGTANPDAAWQWLQFLSTHLNHDEYGRIPARQSLAEGNPVWQPQIEPDRLLGYALRHAYYPPVTFDKTAVDTLITQAVTGQVSVADVLSELAIAPPVVEAAPAATPIPVATAVPPVSQETAVIRYFADFRTHGDAARVQSLADQFNAAQDQVQVTIGSNVRTASSFGLETVAAQYDCFSWGPLSPNETAHVYDLDPLLAAETAVTLPISEYDVRLLDQFMVSGTLYAIPASSIPTVIALNTTYLEQIGASLPNEAWTLDDFRTFAQDVATEEDGQPVYGFTTLQGEEGSPGLLLTDGSVQPYTLTDGRLTVSYDTPEILTALNQLVSLAADQTIFPAYDLGSQTLNQDNWDRRQQLIATGRVAMWTTIAGLEEEVSFDRLILSLPQGIVNFSPPISTGYYISRGVENPSACWAWLTFLAGQETAVIGVPARDSIAQSTAWKSSVGSREAAIYATSLTRQLNSAPGLDALLLTTPLQSWWNDLLAAAYSGEDVALLLPEVQRKGEIYASCLNSAAAKNAETVTNCAREADPAYKTFQELAQELGGS